jgi:hypothetical protein
VTVAPSWPRDGRATVKSRRPKLVEIGVEQVSVDSQCERGGTVPEDRLHSLRRSAGRDQRGGR